MDAYLPAMPAMAAAFGVSIVSLNNTLSVFLIGYAVGQFFGGSFSDQIGRKRIGYTGLSLYILASLGVVFAQDVQQMLVLRFLQAIGGGFSTVICMATVRFSCAVRLEVDLRRQGGLCGDSARVVCGARARDKAWTLAGFVGAFHLPTVLGSRHAQDRRPAASDPVRALDGPCNECAHGLRYQRVVRVHGVLRSWSESLSTLVRPERDWIHVHEPIQHAEP
jgi:hypothetical protein